MDQGVVSIANFLTGLIIGRVCAKEQFGLYMLGFTIITVASDFQDSLISAPYTIYRPRLEAKALVQYTGSSLVHQLIFSGGIILLLMITKAALSLGFGPPGLEEVIGTLLFVIGFLLLRNFARSISFAALRMKTAMLLDGVVSAVQVGGLLLLAHLDLISASRAYWVIGAACGVGLLPWFLSSRQEFQLKFRLTGLHLRQNATIGIWIFASGLVWTLGNSLYPWFLASYHGTSSTGVWAACLGIVALLNPLYLGLQNSFGPKIAHAYAERGEVDLRRFSLQATAVFAVVIAPFCIVLCFLGGDFVTSLYGKKFAGNNSVVSLLAINFFVSALAFSPSRALLTVERADLDFKINLLMFLFLLLFGIFLVRSFGPAGAAAGLLASNSVCLLFRFIAFFRLVRMRAGSSPHESNSRLQLP